MSIWNFRTLKGYITDCQKPSLWILWLTSENSRRGSPDGNLLKFGGRGLWCILIWGREVLRNFNLEGRGVNWLVFWFGGGSDIILIGMGREQMNTFFAAQMSFCQQWLIVSGFLNQSTANPGSHLSYCKMILTWQHYSSLYILFM